MITVLFRISLFTVELGLSGVPVFNTNNNCSSASTALMMAKTFIHSRQYNCALVLGTALNVSPFALFLFCYLVAALDVE